MTPATRRSKLQAIRMAEKTIMTTTAKPSPDKDGWIYCTKIRLKNGRVLHASECGKKAFRFKPSQDE